MEVPTPENHRLARMYLEKGNGASTLSLVVPRDTNADATGILQTGITENIIADLTGCPYLTGTVDVIFRGEFADVIRVDLQTDGIVH